MYWPALKITLETLPEDCEDTELVKRLGISCYDVGKYDPAHTKNNKEQQLRGLLLQRLHAAMVLRALAQERPSEEVCAHFGFTSEKENELNKLQESGSRKLYCAASMCEARGQPELQVMFARLQQRVVAGTQQELVELADVGGVNRLRARALYNSGIQTLDILVAQSWESVAQALAKVNPNASTRQRFGDRRLAEKILRNARSAVSERDRRNRQETLDKLQAAGLDSEALRQVEQRLNELDHAGAARGPPSAAALLSPAAATAALASAAERALQIRHALAAAAEGTDPVAPPLPAAPPLPLSRSPPAEVAAAMAQLAALSGACVLGDADAVAFEALLHSLCAAPLYAFSFAVDDAARAQPRTLVPHGVALALRLGAVVYVSFEGNNGAERRDAIAAILAQQGPIKVALHVKTQIQALAAGTAAQDVPSACLAAIGAGVEDPFICAYLLAPDRERDGVKADRYKLLDMADVAHAAVTAASRFRGALQPSYVQDASFNAATAFAVRAPLRRMLEGPAALHLPLARVEMPLVPVLAAMELLGVPFRRADLDAPLQLAERRLVGAPAMRVCAACACAVR